MKKEINIKPLCENGNSASLAKRFIGSIPVWGNHNQNEKQNKTFG